ncbi:acetylxylan esterase [uncultured Winogradskyella sp.]|uniref:acetylxylan esterase n=1 Tax=uncultured Winogradskyella sp. TaxID=395353 RepID=UPI0026234F48|nr:acetylxylan esterase [uncultured Winogradskyella sp.]
MKKFTNTILLFFIICVSTLNSQTNFDEEFKSFWDSTIVELNKIPKNIRKLNEEQHNGKLLSLYRINSWNNIDFHIYVSEPINKGKYETRIKFSPFGKQDYTFDEVTKDYFMRQDSLICVKVDNRGQGLSRDEISNDRFILNGIGNKENYVYRGVFMDVYRSVNFISSHSKSNGVIVATGGSQGGMLALVASALNSEIDVAIVRIPFFAGINKYNKENRWPMRWILNTSENERGISKEEQLKQLSYYDVKNFAKFIDIPVFIGSCENDPITPYEAILEAFTNIKNKDKMIYVVSDCYTHGYKSEIEQQISKLFLELNLKKIYEQKTIQDKETKKE